MGFNFKGQGLKNQLEEGTMDKLELALKEFQKNVKKTAKGIIEEEFEDKIRQIVREEMGKK